MKANKEITIYDIADQLGVSPATVSRALNDNPSISISTRKKVNSLAEKLGYRHKPTILLGMGAANEQHVA